MTGLAGEPDGATSLDPEEREGLRFRHITTRGELDELEQANIQSGLAWLGRRRSPDVLSDHFIRELHRRLFGEVWLWAGTFRLTGKNIGVEPAQIAVQLRMLVDDADFWAGHGTFPPLEAAARYHHRLVQIHCFTNGNGRHARIAADAYLKARFDHKPIDWAGGFDLVRNNDRRDAYIAALRAADRGDYEPLFLFVGHQRSSGTGA